MSRVLKGDFNERPPRPKYHSTWDVNLVLELFRKEGIPSLTLQKLTFRTVMLFALTRPCRGADLVALYLNNRAFHPEGVVFNFSHLSKQSRPSHCNVVFFFPSFQDDERLCPVEALKAYKAKTSQFHTKGTENHLFRSFIGEHKPVCSSTIARWLKNACRKQ